MKSLLWAVVGVALFVSGCCSFDGAGKGEASVIGRPIQSLLQANAGNRIEMFDKDGAKVEELPQQPNASVSIYNKDQTGQDNYTLDENGVVVKHLRSYGENFTNMKWEAAK